MIPKIPTQTHDSSTVSESSEAFSSQASYDLSHTLSLLESLQRSVAAIQKDLTAKSVRQVQSVYGHAVEDSSSPLNLTPPQREQPFRYAQQIQFLQDQIADLKSELSFIKTKVRQTVPSSRALCSGPLFLIACLLAISLFAITIIILASLGLAGILPQMAVVMVSQANMLWAVVSASIVTTICLTSVCSVFFIKQTAK